MLSPRAEAFLVHNLLRQDCYGQEHKSTPVQLSHYREAPLDHTRRWTGLCRSCVRDSPASDLHEEPWCSSYEADFTTLCRHPSVITSSDEHHVQPVTMELSQADLWQAFHSLGTEMIITKSGRRMFPPIRVHISGLEPNSQYRISLEFAQCGVNKYRYVYHSSKWMVAGLRHGEEGDGTSDRTYVHLDCPLSGQTLMSQVLSFEKVKLTNSARAKPGQVSLSSMQKFQPKLHLQKLAEAGQKETTPPERMTFVFPQTSFIAVTAYQNNQITRLKIETNPFAKGFREDDYYKNFIQMPKETANLPGPPFWTPVARYAYPVHDGRLAWKRPRMDMKSAVYPRTDPMRGRRIGTSLPRVPADSTTAPSSSWIHPAFRDVHVPSPTSSWVMSRRPHSHFPLSALSSFCGKFPHSGKLGYEPSAQDVSAKENNICRGFKSTSDVKVSNNVKPSPPCYADIKSSTSLPSYDDIKTSSSLPCYVDIKSSSSLPCYDEARSFKRETTPPFIVSHCPVEDRLVTTEKTMC